LETLFVVCLEYINIQLRSLIKWSVECISLYGQVMFKKGFGFCLMELDL